MDVWRTYVVFYIFRKKHCYMWIYVRGADSRFQVSGPGGTMIWPCVCHMPVLCQNGSIRQITPHNSPWTPTVVGGRRPITTEIRAQTDAPAFRTRRFRPIFAHSASTVRSRAKNVQLVLIDNHHSSDVVCWRGGGFPEMRPYLCMKADRLVREDGRRSSSYFSCDLTRSWINLDYFLQFITIRNELV